MKKVDLHGSLHRAKSCLDTGIQDIENVLDNLNEFTSNDIYPEEIGKYHKSLWYMDCARGTMIGLDPITYKKYCKVYNPLDTSKLTILPEDD